MKREEAIVPELNLKYIIAESREVAQALNEFADNLERIEKKYVDLQESKEDKEIWCTECPYFMFVKDDNDDIGYYGAKCHKDGHEADPSMYAIQTLHDDCPLKKESEE